MPAFMINSDAATPQPQDMRHPTRPIVGYTLAGKPVLQGYDGLEVTYELLSYDQMTKLQELYNALAPDVTITFPDPTGGGNPITRNAMMAPPQIGGRTTLYFTSVVVTFTHLTLYTAPGP